VIVLAEAHNQVGIKMTRCLVLFATLSIVFSLRAQQKPTKPSPSAAKSAEDSQLYRNVTFGFRYRIPVGWVDRTKEMQKAGDVSNGEVLLAIFERPPQAAGDTVNSAVVIVAESAAAYPGLKRAEDYIGPLTELATAKGFKSAGDASAVEIDSRQLVRADFSKTINDKLTMRQSTLVLLQKGQIVSFTFISGSEDEVNDLIEELGFGASKSRLR
jgi:hypothetical protein